MTKKPLIATVGAGRMGRGLAHVFAYAGHQIGHFVPQLGDGRALLLGEILTPKGKRYDLQFKGY